ncbi:hypothetical protein POX_b02909 [Penicillium oxalicum]|uniref:hypothetical protein n=1 Tax=Penicillium oxalicum TaxID=69781 RepID=UPI0020B6CC5D|nr:hypothetical protein POX_b02909 [Penicillium oxalicum]KAI2792866.1 hypothetical protein POX_b02909 [Penicillium oxalicum]
MGAVSPYGQLARSAARSHVLYAPRRTFTSTVVCQAQNDNGNPPSNKKKSGFFSSVKDWVLGESKPKAAFTPMAPKREEGGLGASSIFADDVGQTSGPKPSKQKKQLQEQQPGQEEEGPAFGNAQQESHAARPESQPSSSIAEIQIKRTERESMSKSHWFKTSVKKLNPLARQIAGKPLDEAILQMRFSKKKAAKDVLDHLEHAKNVAMVRAGMGLGLPSGTSAEPVTVTLKSGERKKINDPTSIYIQQAWVNRGPYGFGMDHRARGQINRLRPPATGLSVVLKEEKTRIREWQQREADALRKRKTQLWTQLPDRKISAQNQYYSW